MRNTSKERAGSTKTRGGNSRFPETVRRYGAAAGSWLHSAGSFFFRFRTLFLAIPVVVAAILLAVHNSKNLPKWVGLQLLSDGSFVQRIPRTAAVFAPLGVTAVCLLLMLGARRKLYPWLISLFSLVIPVLILVLNTYPM